MVLRGVVAGAEIVDVTCIECVKLQGFLQNLGGRKYSSLKADNEGGFGRQRVACGAHERHTLQVRLLLVRAIPGPRFRTWGTRPITRGLDSAAWVARYNGLCLNLQSSTLVKAVLP
jgi:hypothetical protein